MKSELYLANDMPSQNGESIKQETVKTNYNMTIRRALSHGLNGIWQNKAAKPHVHKIQGKLLKMSLTIKSV